MAETFGGSLRQYRRLANLSQRELAERIGLDFSYISKIENNRIPPPAADTVISIARALGLPAEQLLALTGKIPNSVQETVSKSTAAQRFLLDAHEMELSDAEWKQIAKSLKQIRRHR